MDSTGSDRTFHKFNDLPKEIRLLIWEHALPGPRIVNIVQRKLKATFGDWARATGATCRRDVFRVAGLEPPYHGLLDASDEGLEWEDANEFDDEDGSMPLTDEFLAQHPRAAQITLLHYPRSFACFGGFPQTHFNIQRDTLYIQGETYILAGPGANLWVILKEITGLFALGDAELFRRVEHLAITVEDVACLFNDEYESPEEELSDVLVQFLGLKTLTIILRHYDLERQSANSRPTNDDEGPSIVFREALQFKEKYLPRSNLHRAHGDMLLLRLNNFQRLDLAHIEISCLYKKEWHKKSEWVMPRIEIKVAVSGWDLEELETSMNTNMLEEKLVLTHEIGGFDES